MASLVLVRGGQHRVVELRGTAVRVGRAPDNTIQIDDPRSSRYHCEFRRADGFWRVRDLGSLNGTFVNELAVTERVLTPGDRVQVGDTSFYYVPGPEAAPAGAAAGALPGVHAGSDQAAAEAQARRLRNYAALLEISKAVNSELSQDRLLALIVDKSMELIGAERGFLILLQDGQPVFKVARDRNGQPIPEPHTKVSRSVLEGVVRSGEPVITLNAQNDLGAFVSIVALEVRSLLCVPLKVREQVAGVVYVDSKISAREFNEESLNLLHAFADQAAVALENAQLYEEAVAARQREERVRRIFQKYVPADVVNSVLALAEGARLSSKLMVTVLFSDIRSFTSISERLPPEEVVAFLNDYLQRMVDIVDAEGGIVDKFIGDAVMAVFGAPVSKPDDALRAVRAALRMLEELDRFNRDQAARGGVAVEIGIGLHTGHVVAGNMGSDKKMEYTVIGDAVNVACRVESLTKELGVRLLATEQCLRAAGLERFRVRPLAPVRVKGRQAPLRVYEVQGMASPGGEDAPTQPALAAPPRIAAPPPALLERPGDATLRARPARPATGGDAPAGSAPA